MAVGYLSSEINNIHNFVILFGVIHLHWSTVDCGINWGLPTWGILTFSECGHFWCLPAFSFPDVVSQPSKSHLATQRVPCRCALEIPRCESVRFFQSMNVYFYWSTEVEIDPSGSVSVGYRQVLGFKSLDSGGPDVHFVFDDIDCSFERL